ncbi:MAG: PilZ domain-containing protein [Candidatus Omnitrophica bacterium]|nr:PilZ domain-containing protein [Candidatus Omnitrophota bacterium]
MRLKMLSWFQKKEKSLKIETPKPVSSAEKRRAVRISSASVRFTLRSKGEPVSNCELADMSTLGIGIYLDQDPEDTEAIFSFHEPDTLAGLELKAQKVRTFTKARPNGKEGFLVGYEFLFHSPDQQQQLIRWLVTQLQEESEKLDLKQEIKPSYSASFYLDPSTQLDIRMPENSEEYEQALSLITGLSVYHALSHTKFFIAIHKGEVAALIPLIPDTVPFKLQADSLYHEHLSSLRSMNRQLGQIGAPYFKEDLKFFRNPATAHLHKLKLLFSLMPHVITYAKNFAHLTDLVSLVPPHLEEFYRLWMFRELGEDAKYIDLKSHQIRKGYRLMCLDLKEFHEKMGQTRPELETTVVRFLRDPALLKHFEHSYFPEVELIQKWFKEKNNVLQNLTQEQCAYFKTLYPTLV